MDYTAKEIEILKKTPPKYKDANMFLHCNHCLSKFLHSELHQTMTPRDFGQYEVSSCKIKVGKKNIGIVVVWCKRCGRSVWDSRHLKHAY